MERISAVVDGRLELLPVLTPQHLVAMEYIRSGRRSECPEEVIRDLISIGWLEERHGKN
ncbi:MAG TPA: hypothetical protein VEZ13_02020 [Brevibacillus sp.]|nr:hypothetical protein [Brevibacillus sp.]